MPYNDSKKSSEEYLRLALPLIAKHGVAINPINYAVFYEYVSGTNEPLQETLDEQAQTPGAVTDGFLLELYLRFISPCDERRMTRVQEEMRHLLSEVSDSVSHAGQEAEQFDRSLGSYEAKLGENPDATTVSQVISSVRSDTHSMQQANSSLTRQLEESKEEIETLRKEVESARQETLKDPLTGLGNRKGLTEAWEQIRGHTNGQQPPLCLLMMDIDHFKRVNDTYGHLLGDKVIKMVATVIRKTVKGKDVAVRYGGEEFAVLLPDTPPEGARALAEQLRTTVEHGVIRRLDSGDTIGGVTISIGVGLCKDGESMSDFIARADAALYRSKEGGRNRVTMATES